MAELAPGTSGPQKPRSKTPWAIAGAVIVVGGFVAALVSGGGSPQITDRGLAGNANTQSKDRSGTSVDAPPPVKGDKVLAAKQLTVKGIVYRAVLSTPDTNGPKRSPIPLYMTLYVGQPSPLSKLDRLKLPYPFARDSYIDSFRPSPNKGDTASALLSWYVHVGDKTELKHHFELSPNGIQVAS